MQGHVTHVPLMQGGEPIYYPGLHKLCIFAGGLQITLEFILKLYLCPLS